MTRPRGGDWLDEEVGSLRKQGVGVLVSLLTPAEAAELGLEHEKDACEAMGLAVQSFPIEDRSVPTNRQRFLSLAQEMSEHLRADRCVVIHCRAGIGRSALLAGAVLACLGVPVGSALREIAAARGCLVPDTDEQRNWLEKLAQDLGKTR